MVESELLSLLLPYKQMQAVNADKSKNTYMLWNIDADVYVISQMVERMDWCIIKMSRQFGAAPIINLLYYFGIISLYA